MERKSEVIKVALQLLAERCPRLVQRCYWAGTASISLEELGHRESFDLDLHTRRALEDVRPILAEIQQAFPGKFQVLQSPDEFGSGFRGVLALPGGESITVEAMSNYEEVQPEELVSSSTAPEMKRVSLARYLADKIQCVVERAEARDLLDIDAVLKQRRELVPTAKQIVAQQDALLLAERLLGWTDEAIEKDLRSYVGVSPADAQRARDQLLQWLKSERRVER